MSEYDLRQWTEHALASIGNEIASFVGMVCNTWESGAVGSDIGKVLLVGGGAYYVAEALRVHIPHLIVPSRPELAIAIGYAAQASELSQREVEKPTSYSALFAGNESDVPVSSPT